MKKQEVKKVKLLSSLLIIFSLATSMLTYDVPYLIDTKFYYEGYIPWWIETENLPKLDCYSLFALQPLKDGWHNQFGDGGVEIPNLPAESCKLWTARIMEDDYGDWLKDPEDTKEWVRKLEPFIKNSNGIVLDLEKWDLWAYVMNFIYAYREFYPNKKLIVDIPDFRVPLDPEMIDMVDQFHLMAYDYDPDSGILAPLSQTIESINSYHLIKRKLVLGIPLYGYVKTDSGWVYVANKEIEKGICEDKHTIDGEVHCLLSGDIYSEDGDQLHLNKAPTVYEDSTCINKKIQLAKRLHLRGVAFWAVGYYPNVWKKIDR